MSPSFLRPSGRLVNADTELQLYASSPFGRYDYHTPFQYNTYSIISRDTVAASTYPDVLLYSSFTWSTANTTSLASPACISPSGPYLSIGPKCLGWGGVYLFSVQVSDASLGISIQRVSGCTDQRLNRRSCLVCDESISSAHMLTGRREGQHPPYGRKLLGYSTQGHGTGDGFSSGLYALDGRGRTPTSRL